MKMAFGSWGKKMEGNGNINDWIRHEQNIGKIDVVENLNKLGSQINPPPAISRFIRPV